MICSPDDFNFLTSPFFFHVEVYLFLRLSRATNDRRLQADEVRRRRVLDMIMLRRMQTRLSVGSQNHVFNAGGVSS